MPTPDAIALSDLHLGSAVCQSKALAAFLEAVRDGRTPTRRLVLNGDVFDGLDFRRLKKSHWKVLGLLRQVSAVAEVVWVAGNHDGEAAAVSHLLGVTVADEVVVESGGRRVLFLHGHRFDRYIERHPFASRLADRIYRILQQTRRTHAFARRVKRRSKHFLRSTELIRTGAVGRAAELGCDAVCCGHTHLPVAFPEDPLPYFNGGCWTESPCHFLSLTAGEVRLHAYDPAGNSALADTQEIPVAGHATASG